MEFGWAESAAGDADASHYSAGNWDIDPYSEALRLAREWGIVGAVALPRMPLHYRTPGTPIAKWTIVRPTVHSLKKLPTKH